MDKDGKKQLAGAFDPRVRLYRDPFTEMLVFTLSVAGAVVAVPVILLVVGAVFEQFSAIGFVVASVLLEWFFIFAVGRPQMSRPEALSWALLWGTLAAAFGLLFYNLVVTAP